MGKIDEALRKAEEEKAGKGKPAPPAGGETPVSPYGFPLADFADPKSSLAESYRALRTNIQRNSLAKAFKTILVTSAVKGDGRTRTVTNLAVVTSAIEGNRTLLIDADLRNPQLHEIFETEQSPGLSDFLQGGAGEGDIVRPTRIGNLKVIPSGGMAGNPSELFHSPRLGEMIAGLKSQYDMIFFDSAPVIPFADSVVLATNVDGILLVVRARQTRREVVRRAKDLLNKTEDKIVGIVFNRVEYVIPQSLYQKL